MELYGGRQSDGARDSVTYSRPLDPGARVPDWVVWLVADWRRTLDAAGGGA